MEVSGPDVISYCPIIFVLKHIYHLQTYNGGEPSAASYNAQK